MTGLRLSQVSRLVELQTRGGAQHARAGRSPITCCVWSSPTELLPRRGAQWELMNARRRAESSRGRVRRVARFVALDERKGTPRALRVDRQSDELTIEFSALSTNRSLTPAANATASTRKVSEGSRFPSFTIWDFR